MVKPLKLARRSINEPVTTLYAKEAARPVTMIWMKTGLTFAASDSIAAVTAAVAMDAGVLGARASTLQCHVLYGLPFYPSLELLQFLSVS